MTDAARFVRRNRVDERSAVAIAIVGGLLAGIAGARPTGSSTVDIALVTLFAAITVWASASAPWWAVASACGIGGALALDPLVAAVGFAGFGVGLWIGIRRRDLAEIRAVLGAVAVNVLIRSELDGFLGLSATVGIGLCIGLFVLGVWRRPRAIRRPVWIATGALAGLAVLAVIGAAASAAASQSDLTAGGERAQDGIDALNDGDYAAAAAFFGDAAEAFDRADRKLNSVVAAPARLVPGVAQNLSAGAELAAAADGAMATAASALRQIDPATLRLVDGAIDIDAVRAVEAPLLEVQETLVRFRTVADDVDSPWLLGRLQDELAELEEELDANEPRLDDALTAVRIAPRMLGADGLRRYLLLFTTPAEARGLAGFVGNYAEITIDGGRIGVTGFGRRSELDEYVGENGATCTECPEELLTRYGPFGLTAGPDGGADDTVWTAITLPAHFPYVGVSAQSLYPQSGGRPVDGVISVDPYVIQALMQYTGPIEVPELGVTVQPDAAAQFILEDQYVLAGDDANADRIDGLETLGQNAIQDLLAGELPEPSALARDLGPLVAEHRLLMWTEDPDEQAFLDTVGMSGAMPALVDDTGFALFVANAGASKIDVFIDRSVTTSIETADDGTRTLVADVEIANNAPTSGLPPYVIGNAVDLPAGTSKLLVTFYGPQVLERIESGGETVGVQRLPEAGWTAYSLNVAVPAGESLRYRLTFALPMETTVEPPVITEWVQPLTGRQS
jgi:hypothetical protein